MQDFDKGLEGKQGLTKDWLLRLLLGIVAFFLAATYFTVQKIDSDVGTMKIQVQSITDKYEALRDEVKLIEQSLKK